MEYTEFSDIQTNYNKYMNIFLGEVTVKWIEAFQTKLPMTLGGGLFGALRLKPK
jgi:hypothetical protein